MNTIKTKIGFDIKPYVIQSIYFKDFFYNSTQIIGQSLLVLATLLSIGNWIYIQSVHQKGINSLQVLQQEGLQHKQQYEQLAIEYDLLSSEKRLESLTAVVNMKQPTHKEIIKFPQQRGR